MNECWNTEYQPTTVCVCKPQVQYCRNFKGATLQIFSYPAFPFFSTPRPGYNTMSIIMPYIGEANTISAKPHYIIVMTNQKCQNNSKSVQNQLIRTTITHRLLTLTKLSAWRHNTSCHWITFSEHDCTEKWACHQGAIAAQVVAKICQKPDGGLPLVCAGYCRVAVKVLTHGDLNTVTRT